MVCPIAWAINYVERRERTVALHSSLKERLLVSGSDVSIYVSVGEDVTLNCSVDSHITPEHIEEVSWKKTDDDEDILVLLYLNNKTLPESSDEQYRDRVEFFTDEIPKGNFSLRLKSVRTEDKGVYMCQVFAGGLSFTATVVLERLVFLVIHTDAKAPSSACFSGVNRMTRFKSLPK
ncbi:Butyrophilin-like protein 2 [Anabarilius grahami]|uniref:Butyrophilin-like protein 2 n=1 Tax=Anabarilius grahami TaxID=495550 RepID=A0A3N0YWN0_ANAGA|nr:Butyrophilin-like protein 2 [Anabarilius grahami]